VKRGVKRKKDTCRIKLSQTLRRNINTLEKLDTGDIQLKINRIIKRERAESIN